MRRERTESGKPLAKSQRTNNASSSQNNELMALVNYQPNPSIIAGVTHYITTLEQANASPHTSKLILMSYNLILDELETSYRNQFSALPWLVEAAPVFAEMKLKLDENGDPIYKDVLKKLKRLLLKYQFLPFFISGILYSREDLTTLKRLFEAGLDPNLTLPIPESFKEKYLMKDEYTIPSVINNQSYSLLELALMTHSCYEISILLLNQGARPSQDAVSLIIQHKFMSEQQKINLLSFCTAFPEIKLDYVIDREGNTPLIWAALGQNVALAEWLITKGVNIRATNFKGQNAAHVAAELGCYGILELLHDKRLALDTADKDGIIPLYYVEYGYLEEMFGEQSLVFEEESRIIPSPTEQIKITTLLVRNTHLDKLKKLDYGGGKGILHLAAELGDEDLLKFLLEEKNFALESQDNSGDTPLFYAILGSLKGFNYLLAKGANIDHLNKQKYNLLDYAVCYGPSVAYFYLVSQGYQHNTFFIQKPSGAESYSFVRVNQFNLKSPQLASHIMLELYLNPSSQDFVMEYIREILKSTPQGKVTNIWGSMEKFNMVNFFRYLSLLDDEHPALQRLLNERLIDAEFIAQHRLMPNQLANAEAYLNVSKDFYLELSFNGNDEKPSPLSFYILPILAKYDTNSNSAIREVYEKLLTREVRSLIENDWQCAYFSSLVRDLRQDKLFKQANLWTDLTIFAQPGSQPKPAEQAPNLAASSSLNPS